MNTGKDSENINMENADTKTNVKDSMMRKDVFIEITGIQIIDGEEDKTQLFTQGRYFKKGGNYFIYYDESETTGYANCKISIKVEGEQKVIMTREGAMNSTLIVESGNRNLGYYGTNAGGMQIGVYAKQVTSKLDDHGGDLSFKYSLEINSEYVSDNEVYVNIKECKK